MALDKGCTGHGKSKHMMSIDLTWEITSKVLYVYKSCGVLNHPYNPTPSLPPPPNTDFVAPYTVSPKVTTSFAPVITMSS